ncbi:pentatricopeptide repeat-containing protein At4g14050, mitochondrial isoform X2 [Prosopis cineraria]|uniref:pentatricopeptide repeat-containing protein At4g14050, mitochondrial isoform X2 n=1 Tax=Prosopis cineraria TaxID=364024 RepID=UPI00240F887E|nr:pentatricopeptide repeat-containing protein At4g14050, mitochondrial isoform X2 [Prosopis cineraria]
MPISQYVLQLQRSSACLNLTLAKKLHAQILKSGLHLREPLPNTLLDAYGKCGIVQNALLLFEEMPHRDCVSWATLLTACNRSNHPHKALSVSCSILKNDKLQPDHFVLASLVKACANVGAVRQGKQVHARFLLSPFWEDDVVKSSLVDMYAKSLISGLIQSGNEVDGLRFFIEMRKDGIDIVDPLVLSSVVGACANLAVMELGKQIHGLVITLGYESCLFISNALVDMYAKCSDLLAAKDIFYKLCKKDVISWTSIIVGAAQHGQAEEALALYDEMVLAGFKPNEVTFVGLIYACGNVGLVDKGRSLFRSMVEDYNITPSLKHYTCLLDLYSRSGYLEEAENIIETMPFKPDEPTWAALLSACKSHGKTQMAIRIADHLSNTKLEDPSTYILLSNIYAGAGMWEGVSKARESMAMMEVKKEPGYSSVDLGKESHVFYAGETCHPLKDEILGLMRKIDAEMRRRGYVPDTSSVLHDMDQQEKERQLFWHSERLAVAYGLLKAVPGTIIRIVKNLRVCGDCHTVLKLISTIASREIYVRDAKRYHHFRDGKCSCNDFW